MKVGLVGFAGSGKTSVFNVLTGQAAETGPGKKGAKNLGRIRVPDERVDALAKMYEPKKITYAEIQFVDVAGPGPEERTTGHGLDPALVGSIRESDALVHVVRAFASPFHSEAADPARDIAQFEDELILTDLIQVERRIERLRKEGKTSGEIDLLGKLQHGLESGRALRSHGLAPDEIVALSGFQFLSQKPLLVVVNQSEELLRGGLGEGVKQAAEARGLASMALCATIEAEIVAMDAADQEEFLKDLGLAEPVRTRFIQAAYRLLDLISFLTVGKDEVRAWTIARGTAAREAAGKVHTDIERGFIRAEVTPYDELIRLGSEAKCKEAGKLRLEGKEYIVEDGDVVHFRHSG